MQGFRTRNVGGNVLGWSPLYFGDFHNLSATPPEIFTGILASQMTQNPKTAQEIYFRVTAVIRDFQSQQNKIFVHQKEVLSVQKKIIPATRNNSLHQKISNLCQMNEFPDKRRVARVALPQLKLKKMSMTEISCHKKNINDNVTI